MAELLLVRSGDTDERVTESFEMEPGEVKRYLGNRELHYLGAELTPIGETSRVSEFAGPDHVVVRFSTTESESFRLPDEGFYVVEGLSPSDIDAS